MQNPKIESSFEKGILFIRFMPNVRIGIEDLKEIYQYGSLMSNGKPYCILFEPTGHYEVSEDAIPFIAEGTFATPILAKAYVVNDKEAVMKTKLHLTFDKPSLKPGVFETREAAVQWLTGILSTNGH